MKISPLQRAYSAEVREHVRQALLANDGNVKRTARETGVPEATVRRWRNEFGIPRLTAVPRPSAEHRQSGKAEDRAQQAECRRLEIREALVAARGNLRKAARETGLSTGTLRRYRIKFGIPQFVPGAADYGAREIGHPEDEREFVRSVLIANGGNVKRTARETHLPEATVRRWRNEFFGDGAIPATAEPRTTPRPDPWESAATRREAFWSRVDKTSSGSGCWLWTGSAEPEGYGRFGGHSAHRFAYEAVHGPLNGRHLHHVCKTKSCVNPAHLLPVEGPEAHVRLEKLEKEFIAYVESDDFLAEMSTVAAGAAC